MSERMLNIESKIDVSRLSAKQDRWLAVKEYQSLILTLRFS